MGLVIHWHESAMELHVFPIPPPTSLSTRFLWVFPVHQAWAVVSCIPPGLVICFTIDNIEEVVLSFLSLLCPLCLAADSLFGGVPKYHFFTPSPASIHTDLHVPGKRKITSINQCFALALASSLLYNKLLHAGGLWTHIFSTSQLPKVWSLGLG